MAPFWDERLEAGSLLPGVASLEALDGSDVELDPPPLPALRFEADRGSDVPAETALADGQTIED